MKIITHPGKAHRDDFLAVCILLASRPNEECYIARREPSERHLDDPKTIVVDIGGRYEPEKMNFDHHQFSRYDKPECAFSLVAKYLGLEQIFECQVWYEATIFIDVMGPRAAAQKLGLASFPYELASPLELVLLDNFASISYTDTSNQTIKLMRELGKTIIANGIDQAKRIKKIEKSLESGGEAARLVDFGNGTKGFIIYDSSTDGLANIRARKYPNVAVCIAYDNRGPGWSIYRYEEIEQIDLFVIRNDDRVKYAHENGFICKTHNLIGVDSLIDLIKKAKVK